MSAIEKIDITRPRSFGSELSCSVALESEMTATLAAPTNGITRNTKPIFGITAAVSTDVPNDRGHQHQSLGGGRSTRRHDQPADDGADAHRRGHRREPLLPAPKVTRRTAAAWW